MERKPAQPSEDVRGQPLREEPVAAKPWQFQPFVQNKVGPLEARLAGLTTHLSLWPASQCLARWLEARQTALGLLRPGLRLLELGAGTGWLGLTLARNLPQAAAIVLSERAEALGELATSCREFAARTEAPALHTALLDWRAFLPLSGAEEQPPPHPAFHHFDVVLGADLAWNHETGSSLPWVFRAILEDCSRQGRRTHVLYGHWLRSPSALEQFLAACDVAGVVAVPDETQAADVAVVPDIAGGDLGDGEPACGGPCAGESALAEGAEGSSSGSEGGWFDQIFNEAPEERPIFSVYRVTLRRGDTPQSGA